MSTTRAPATATTFGEFDLESDEEPLRETREPFREALRDTVPEPTRPSGMRLSAPGSIEEAVLRVIEELEPFEMLEPVKRAIPKA